MIKEIRRITMERPLTGWSWVWRDSVTGERGRARIELDGLTRGDEVTVELTCECGWEATRFLDVPAHLLSFDRLFTGGDQEESAALPMRSSPPSVGEVRVTEVAIDGRSTAHRDAGRPSKARPGVVTWVDDHVEQVGLLLIFGTNSAVRREGLGRRLKDWREAGLRKPGFVASAEIVRSFDALSECKGELTDRDRAALCT